MKRAEEEREATSLGRAPVVVPTYESAELSRPRYLRRPPATYQVEPPFAAGEVLTTRSFWRKTQEAFRQLTESVAG
jgi:hypothetical protein